MTKLHTLLRANPDEEPPELSQKLLTRLQGFTPHAEGRALIEASIEWVDDFELEEEIQKRVDERINEAWSMFVLLTAEERAWFYDAILAVLEQEEFIDPRSARQTAKLTELFALRKASLESSYALRDELRAHHPRVLKLLKAWNARGTGLSPEDQVFCGLAHSAASLFEVYFNHPHYMDDDDLRVEASLILPELIRTFYPACSPVHIYMLGYHPDYLPEIARLIDFYLKLDLMEEQKGKAYLNLAVSFLGEGSPVLERGIAPVLDILAEQMKEWSDSQFNEFIEVFVYYPLLRHPLLQIARSSDRRLVLELIAAQKRSTPYALKAEETLHEVKEMIQKIQEDRMPNREGGVCFADFNFKLAVIEELMYKQQVLRPQFDIGVFVQQYAMRKISIAEEGDRPIPEVREYFERLTLTEQDLRQVTKLVIGTGQQVQQQIIPFWNGEDGYFDVHSLEDLRHLPNLSVMQADELLKAEPAPAVEKNIILVRI